MEYFSIFRCHLFCRLLCPVKWRNLFCVSTSKQWRPIAIARRRFSISYYFRFADLMRVGMDAIGSDRLPPSVGHGLVSSARFVQPNTQTHTTFSVIHFYWNICPSKWSPINEFVPCVCRICVDGTRATRYYRKYIIGMVAQLLFMVESTVWPPPSSPTYSHWILWFSITLHLANWIWSLYCVWRIVDNGLRQWQRTNSYRIFFFFYLRCLYVNMNCNCVSFVFIFFLRTSTQRPMTEHNRLPSIENCCRKDENTYISAHNDGDWGQTKMTTSYQ